MGKLTKAQESALSIVNDAWRLHAWGSGRAAAGASLWALERRYLVVWGRDADGVYFEMTEAGRAALKSGAPDA